MARDTLGWSIIEANDFGEMIRRDDLSQAKPSPRPQYPDESQDT